MLSTLVIIAFVLCCLANLSYWSILCTSLTKFYQKKQEVTSQSPVTILVCTNNDSHHLKTLLESLNQQINVTSQVSVLIVNDFSDTKHTAALAALTCRFPIKIIEASQEITGKKAALITGLKAVKSGTILLTDADCKPRPHWISILSSQVQGQKAALGYSPFVRHSSFLNIWTRFEGLITAIQYLGWAAAGTPYLGVGRSLAIDSQAINQLTLDDLNPTVASGDDDMLIQYLKSAQPSIHSAAFVDTEGPRTWRSYLRQKRRHYSISPSYTLSHKIRLSIFSFSQILILLIGCFGFTMQIGIIMVTVWCMRILCIAVISRSTFKQLEQGDLWFLLPILDVLLSIYYLVFGMTFLLPKPKSW